MAPTSHIMRQAAMQVYKSGLLSSLQPSTYLAGLDPQPVTAARYFPTRQLIAQLLAAFSDPTKGDAAAQGEAAAATLLMAAIATEQGSRTLGSLTLISAGGSSTGNANGQLDSSSSGGDGGGDVTPSAAAGSPGVQLGSEGGLEEDGLLNKGGGAGGRRQHTFDGMNESQVADWLMQAFSEPAPQRKVFEMYASSLGIPAMEELLQEAETVALSGKELVRDQKGVMRPRTPGGIFLRLAKQRKADKSAKTYMATTETMVLRPYQRAAVEYVDSHRDTNHIIVAPTGSGKTAIFVDIARRQLEAKPDSKILVLVPTIPLTVQHHTQFQRAGFQEKGWCVEHISSDRPLQKSDWSTFLARQSVIICVHQCLLNLLATEQASLEQLDLLVLDECHHTAKDHPYKRIMDYYKPGINKRTRVIGFTASPASNITMDSMINEVQALKAKMRAELYTIHEQDSLVQAVAPSPNERELRVPRRTTDIDMEQVLHGFLLKAAAEVGVAMLQLEASPHEVNIELRGQAKSILNAICKAADAGSNVMSMPATAGSGGGVNLTMNITPQKDLVSATAELKQAMVLACGWGALFDLKRLLLCFKLLGAVRTAMELVQEVGYEGALQYLARKLVDVCCQHNTLSGAAGTASTASASAASASIASASTATPAGSAAAGASGSTAAGLGAGGASGSATLPASAGRVKLMFRDSVQKLTPGLAQQAAAAPSPESLMQKPAAAAKLRPGGGSCADLDPAGPLSVVSLGREFLTLPSIRDRHRVLNCFQSGLAVQAECFPKWWALLDFLVAQYMKSGDFHGMVFLKSRQAVYHIVDVINRTQQLDFLTAVPFIGHGNKKPKHDAGSAEDRHLHGMSGNQQQAALDAFKAPGCKLLVATTAAEEGIDVQSCEFVVRYSAAATGVQRVQSRGRSRMAGSQFLQIIQDDTLDGHLHHKSRKEEDNMSAYLTEHYRQQQAGQRARA